jgi:hypothetical protein
MKSLYSNSAKSVSYKKLLTLSDQFNLATTDFLENKITSLSSFLKMKKLGNNIEIIHVTLPIPLIISKINDPKSIENIILDQWCGYFNKGEKNEDLLINVLPSYMEQGKIIYIYLDMYDYILNEEFVEKNDRISYNSHSTSCIMYPNVHGSYNTYYFNPHGHDLLDNKEFDLYISQFRSKNIQFDIPLDNVVMNNFISVLNKHLPIYLHYESTEIYNYYGPNLQVNDNHGICYLFPFLIFHELLNHLDMFALTCFCNNNILPFILRNISRFNKKVNSYLIQKKNKKINIDQIESMFDKTFLYRIFLKFINYSQHVLPQPLHS